MCTAFVTTLPEIGLADVAGEGESRAGVRRVCVQAGLPTIRRAEDRAASVPRRLGGGTYLLLTGRRDGEMAEVRTLSGERGWVVERDPEVGAATLCVPPQTEARVCPPGGTAVAAVRGEPAGPPVALADANSTVRLHGYFEDRGRWAFGEVRGVAGFLDSGDLCETPLAGTSPATTRFHMVSAPAAPDCYQWRRARTRGEIRRIVIHNTELPLSRTITNFRECSAARPRSAHVAIDRDGTLYRMVEDRFAAFHTGGVEHSGGFNALSLGVEVVAFNMPGFGAITRAQETALLALLRFWMHEYGIVIPDKILKNSTASAGYADREFWEAPLTIHRFVSADRGTDCPKLLWPDSAAGDDEFFAWRRRHFGNTLR